MEIAWRLIPLQSIVQLFLLNSSIRLSSAENITAYGVA